MPKIIVILLSLLFLIYLLWETENNDQYYAGIPQSEETTIIDNTGFSIGYSELHKNPIWVSYRLFKVDNPTSGKRPSKFEVDNRTESKVAYDDYTHSGYDRGHMAPNYAISTRYGREAQLQTFLMSNICPQRPTLNRQIWNRLEHKIANTYANDFEEIWVVTGPIFDDHVEKLESGVEIPDAFYKIIVDEEDGNPRMQAFIIAQDVVGSEKYEKFLVRIDSVESVTGIDFFSGLDDRVENRLEAMKQDIVW